MISQHSYVLTWIRTEVWHSDKQFVIWAYSPKSSVGQLPKFDFLGFIAVGVNEQFLILYRVEEDND